MARRYDDEYWTKEATSYDITLFLIRNLRPFFARRYARIMRETIARIERPMVLEVGCGTAATLKYLRKSTPELEGYGFDTSRVAIEIARGNEGKCRFFRGDALNIPFKERFDLAYSIGLIEHYSREEAVEVISQKKIALVRGGYAGAVVPAKGGLLDMYERFMGDRWLFEKEIPFTREELKRLLEKAGLKEVEVHYIYFMTLLGIGRKA